MYISLPLPLLKSNRKQANRSAIQVNRSVSTPMKRFPACRLAKKSTSQLRNISAYNTSYLLSFASNTGRFPQILLIISSRFTKYDPFYQTPMGRPSAQVLESFRWARATWVYVSSCITQKSMPLSLGRQMVFSLRFLWLPCLGGCLVDPLKLAFKFVFGFGFADVPGLWKGEGFWGLKV